MFSLPARRYFQRIPPRSSTIGTTTTGIPGTVAVLPVTTGASYVNLGSLFAQSSTSATSSAFGDQTQGVLGVRICLQAITATVGLIAGNAAADVSGANAPVIATQGTLTNGLYTAAAGTCWQMIPGQPSEILEFEPALSLTGPYQDLFLGFVGSTSGSLLLFQCSNPSPL